MVRYGREVASLFYGVSSSGGSFYLLEDGVSRRCRVGGARDGAAYDQHGGSALDGGGGCGDALLVADLAAGGADAGDDEDGFVAQLGPQRSDLFGRADHAVDSRVLRELCQPQDLFGGSGIDAGSVELRRIHAGKDGDGEQPWRTGSEGSLGGGGHHDRASGGVDGEQGGSRLCRGADGSGDGVGNVVELEVEEDVEAAVAEGLDEGIAGGVVKLHADLEPLAGAGELVHEVEGGFGGGEVEGDGEAVFR